MICRTLPITVRCPEKVTETSASAALYLPDNFPVIDPERRRPTVILCPGGSYKLTSDTEAEPVGLPFLAADCNVVVFKYSVLPDRFPTALYELGTLVMLLREHAEEWHVDPDAIIVGGFSAGGHLAASYCTLWNRPFVKEFLHAERKENRPNGMLLGYPVISTGDFISPASFRNLLGDRFGDPAWMDLVSCEKQVDADTPPAFLWHTAQDTCVPPQNSLLMVSALLAYGIPAEYHLFARGTHGMGLVNEMTVKDYRGQYPEVQKWVELAIRWIRNLKTL